MARYQLILAYDGTCYKGFQRQNQISKASTVQGAIEKALTTLGWDGKTIFGAGRTDAGVHAFGQVIAFDIDWKHGPKMLQEALNAVLPQDICIKSAAIARDDFHPRYQAIARTYRYRIYCEESRHPLLDRYAWRVWPAIDLRVVEQEALALNGQHDFSAFGSAPKKNGSTIRTVFSASWKYWKPESELVGLEFEIVANGFLYRMIRRLVFLQVEVAHAKYETGMVKKLLDVAHVKAIQGLAPPNGLTLMGISYENNQEI
jgi:tRNA pseudouridine38-40 synthase